MVDPNLPLRKLTKLASLFAENDAVTTYVRPEIAHGELTIAEPPAIGGVSAIRNLLLREGIAWERHLAPAPRSTLSSGLMANSLNSLTKLE